MDPKRLGQILQVHDIKPSHHRIRIYQYLLERKNHPTVDTIYKDLLGEIPTLSKTTLYNTLSLFVQKGVVLLITIEENETRYDADVSLHGHLKCSNCGKIFDIRIDISNLDLSGLDNFQVTDSQVYFKGICPICLQSRDKHIN